MAGAEMVNLQPCTERNARAEFSIVVLLLCATVAVLGRDLSVGGFRHGDGAAHAMDGVLIHDWLVSGPKAWVHPIDFASRQYAHYPTLGIGRHYPPGFAMVEAAFFAVFGVSVVSARLCVLFLGLCAAGGVYVCLRFVADRWASAAGVVAFLAMPATTLWGRQVMLEVPTLAVLIWAAAAFYHYLRRPTWGRLGLLLTVAVSAVFFKQPAVFLMGALAGVFVVGMLRRVIKPSHGFCVILVTVAAAVIVVLSLDGHGAQLLRGDATFPHRWSWPALTFYLRKVPRQVGWSTLFAATVGLLIWVTHIPRRTQPSVNRMEETADPGSRETEHAILCSYPRIPPREQSLLHVLFLVAWFVSCYGLLVLADYKNPRFLYLALFPLVVWAGVGVGTLTRMLSRRRLGLASLSLLLMAWCGGAVRAPTACRPDYSPVVLAHRDDLIGRAVLFSGLRDGDFVFAVRQHLPGYRTIVIRGSKLFYTCNGRVDLDFVSNVNSPKEVGELMRRFAFKYAFVERRNKLGLREDRWLRGYLAAGGDYRRVDSYRFQMGSVPGRRDSTIDVYEFVAGRRRQVSQFDILIPRAHRTIRIDLRNWS